MVLQLVDPLRFSNTVILNWVSSLGICKYGVDFLLVGKCLIIVEIHMSVIYFSVESYVKLMFFDHNNNWIHHLCLISSFRYLK